MPKILVKMLLKKTPDNVTEAVTNSSSSDTEKVEVIDEGTASNENDAKDPGENVTEKTPRNETEAITTVSSDITSLDYTAPTETSKTDTTETVKASESDSSDNNEEDYFILYDPEYYYYENGLYDEVVETTTKFTLPIFTTRPAIGA